jgi:predicted O-linked N-acetylglucosamine transferase (SPINDLY family)
MQQAVVLHQQGRLTEAENLYLRALMEQPDLFEARYYLGVLKMQQNRLADAATLLEGALRLRSDDVTALVNYGLTLHTLGRATEALSSFDRALAVQPDSADIQYRRGALLAELGRSQEALAALDQALALRADFPEAVFFRGIVLGDLGRNDEAKAAYDRVLALAPDHPEALNNRALLAWQRRDAQAALADHDRALAVQPSHVPNLANRALVLGAIGRPAEALADYDRIVALAPKDAEMWNRRGAIQRALGRSDEALASFDQVLRLKPDFATALNNRGFLLWAAKRRYEEAKSDLTRAFALEPSLPYLEGELLYLKMQAAEWDGFAEARAALAEGVAAGKPVVRPFAWQAISADPASLQQCARIFAREYPPAPASFGQAARSADKIRIGYVSADFREQATAYLMAGVYESHDPRDFEIVALDNGGSDRSPMRARLEKAFSRIIDITRLSDAQAATAIATAGIDILVNLNGYFGKPRSEVFAARPAPLQVNYLGFPATLGTPAIDYIIADRIVIPQSETRFYDEAVVWLPGSYQANDSKRPRPAPPGRAAAGLPDQGFVFCNFNQAYKLGPETFARWMRILRACDGSLLWLLADNEVFAANLKREAQKQGVAPERLIFAPGLKLEDHLARLALADLFLDSLPYNAHTTASDALWAGVPLLTCRGTAFPGRVAASLLEAAGLPELVTENGDSYEELAVRLAKDAALLARYRTRLADQRLTCPLFDTARFTRHLESAYRTMWQTHRDGGKPHGFSVS